MGGSANGEEAARLTELLRSLEAIAARRRDLRLRAETELRLEAHRYAYLRGGLVQPYAGVFVTLQPESGGAGATVRVLGRRARFRAWPGEGGRRSGARALGGRLGIDLSAGYRWADRTFDGPQTLATEILLFLRRKVEEVERRSRTAARCKRNSGWRPEMLGPLRTGWRWLSGAGVS